MREVIAVLRVLGKRSSINVRKVLWTCDEIGLAYELEEWGAEDRQLHSAEFVRLNPKRLVPVVVDDDEVLTESNTIVRYLAAKHRRSDLLPAEALGRARVEEVMDWQATELNTSWRIAFQALVRGRRDLWSEPQIERSLAEWNSQMRLIEDRLADGRPFVTGGGFTVADIVVGLSVNRWLKAPIERPHLPRMDAYIARLRSRPAAAAYLGAGSD